MTVPDDTLPGDKTTTAIFLTVLLPFGLGYYLSYLYRTVNGVIAPHLASDLALSASELGLLTSLYFICFAAFQTPLGVLLDRFGPRRVQAGLLLFAAMGSALFAISENFVVLAIARGLIGLGVSGCLMAALKANVIWFRRERLPLVNGCIVAFGSFGALSATVPVEIAFGIYGWRPIFGFLAAVTLAVVLFTWFTVPDKAAPKNTAKSSPTVSQQFREVGAVYRSAFFWRIAIVTFLHNGVYLSYQSLWMGPWLRDVANMGQGEIAQSLLWFNAGMFAGVLTIGVLAERLQAAGVRLITIVAVGIAGSLIVQGLFASEAVSIAKPLCAAFGFFGSSSLLAYAVLAQHFPAGMIGRVNTAQNMLTFIAAFAAQWGVGAIINRWAAAEDGRYDPAGHQTALLVMLTIEVAALLWFLFPRRNSESDVHG
jgi:predicted MFS family arabinose efflux permease